MPLHKDREGQGVLMPDGRIIYNLSDEEYDAGYTDGDTPKISDDVLAEAISNAEKMGTQDA